jgi:glycerophosphoryl diester phosphodiesterase
MSRQWRMGTGALAVALAGAIVGFVPSTTHAAEADPSASPLPAGRRVGNVAHMGASLQAPENTLAAMQEAIAKRANFVGIDVRRTKDNRLVVLHDNRLRRTTNVERVFPRRASWPIGRFTLAQVRRLDAGSWKSPSYAGERIPTLRRVLRELRPSRTGVFLEIKQPHLYGRVNGIGDQVIRAIRKYTGWLRPGRANKRLVVQAFNDGFLRSFANRYDRVGISTLGGARKLRAYSRWAEQINVNQTKVNRNLVRRAHNLGLRVTTFVVNRRPAMRKVIRAGVDAVSTDRPERLYQVLRKRSRVMPARRPPSEPVSARLSVRSRDRAMLRTRVPVVARVRGDNGSRARWTWVRVQLWTGDHWRTLQRRATGRLGNLETSVRTRHRLRLRVVSERTDWYRRTRPIVRDIDTRRWPTQVRLFGDRRLRGDDSTRLRVRWEARNGKPITGRARLMARPRRDGQWRRVQSVRVTDGRDRIRVSPNRDTRYRLIARRGSWWAGDRDGHVIDHLRRRR